MNFDLGFLGGGQLARMSIQAAQRMGLRCLSIDSSPDSPAGQIAPAVVGDIYDAESLAKVLSECSRATLENEFIPANTISAALHMAGRDEAMIVPNLQCLETIQDKLSQRKALQKAGVPCPNAVELTDDPTAAIAIAGFPMVIKARTGGYDGKGTRYCETAEDLEDFRELWEGGGWLAEEFVAFKRELAVICFRSETETGCFPTMETLQTNHVCDLVFPADIDASKIALDAVIAVGGNGLFGVELFELTNGEIWVNEIAPRPHNSGHYTLDWGGPSQFDHHVRVSLGLPSAPLDGVPTCMANILGQEGAQDWRVAVQAMLKSDPGVRFHWYGKSESKPGRKMGHINTVGSNMTERAQAARKVFYAAWTKKSTATPDIG